VCVENRENVRRSCIKPLNESNEILSSTNTVDKIMSPVPGNYPTKPRTRINDDDEGAGSRLAMLTVELHLNAFF
jgi:hypothetical protein